MQTRDELRRALEPPDVDWGVPRPLCWPEDEPPRREPRRDQSVWERFLAWLGAQGAGHRGGHEM